MCPAPAVSLRRSRQLDAKRPQYAGISVDLGSCPTLGVRVLVANEGNLGVPAGVVVSFYADAALLEADGNVVAVRSDDGFALEVCRGVVMRDGELDAALGVGEFCFEESICARDIDND